MSVVCFGQFGLQHFHKPNEGFPFFSCHMEGLVSLIRKEREVFDVITQRGSMQQVRREKQGPSLDMEFLSVYSTPPICPGDTQMSVPAL